MTILNLVEIDEIFLKILNFRILKIGKPRPERVFIFPNRQTSSSVGVNMLGITTRW